MMQSRLLLANLKNAHRVFTRPTAMAKSLILEATKLHKVPKMNFGSQIWMKNQHFTLAAKRWRQEKLGLGVVGPRRNFLKDDQKEKLKEGKSSIIRLPISSSKPKSRLAASKLKQYGGKAKDTASTLGKKAYEKMPDSDQSKQVFKSASETSSKYFQKLSEITKNSANKAKDFYESQGQQGKGIRKWFFTKTCAQTSHFRWF